jgi:hypothetical protein
VPKSDERRQPPYSAPDAPGGSRRPRAARHLIHLLRQRWELTPLGCRALTQARERQEARAGEASTPRCCWCEREIRPGDAVIPATADDRLMHYAPECRGEFERFVYGEPSR